MARLIELPPELLAEICTHLCDHCLSGQQLEIQAAQPWRAALMSLNRVCRLLHAVAQPFLYHSFQITQESDFPFFLRTLLDRPDLASRVLEVGVYQPGLVVTMLVRRGLRLIDRAIEAPMDALPLPYARRLQDIYSSLAPPGLGHVPDGMELVEVLLHLASNVQSCHFRRSREEYNGDIVETYFSTHSFTTSLKRLAFSSFDGDFVLGQAASILQLVPNLYSLHYHQCCDVTESFSASLGQVAGSPPLQNLRELNLTDTFMTAASFRNLLGTIGPKLSKVSIQGIETETESRQMSRDEKTVRFGEAVLALQPWKRELKTLRFTNDKMDLAPATCYLKGIHALRNLQALETIEAPTPSFDFYGQLGDQEDALALTLPAFVRELRLPGFPEKVQLVPSLRGLVRALRAGHFVNLRKIGIDSKNFQDRASEPEGEPMAELKEVVASLRSLSVDFSILS